MLRRGRHKFIHSPSDPDQLYDLAADPDELGNLATGPDAPSELRSFRADVAQGWDFARLTLRVIASQRRRRLVGLALAKGQHTAWDYQPVRDASRQYIRNHGDLEDIEAMARFPRFGAGVP
jgi:choline-sulfatase